MKTAYQGVRDQLIVLGIVAVLCLASIVYTIHVARACRRSGGVVVRDVWNLPACVAAPRER